MRSEAKHTRLRLYLSDSEANQRAPAEKVLLGVSAHRSWMGAAVPDFGPSGGCSRRRPAHRKTKER